MLNILSPAPLEDVNESHEIGARIGDGVLQGVTDAGLGRKVNDAFRPYIGEDSANRARVGHISGDEPKSTAAKTIQPCELKVRVVVGIQVVDSNNLVPAPQQRRCDCSADEACGPGDEPTRQGRPPRYARSCIDVMLPKSSQPAPVVAVRGEGFYNEVSGRLSGRGVTVRRSIRNVALNALRPGYFPVMVGKLAKRLESDTGPEATAWARERAQPVEAYCRSIDGALWDEVRSSAQRMGHEASVQLQRMNLELGGGGAFPLLWFLVRRLRPTVVVETGVAAGWSSRAILEAMEENGEGTLYSSDFPYFRLKNPETYIGCLVPESLAGRWRLDARGDRKALPDILKACPEIGLVHYDSDKSYSGRHWAMAKLSSHLTDEAIVVMDDVHDNFFFRDWVTTTKAPFRILEFEGKFVGLAGSAASIT